MIYNRELSVYELTRLIKELLESQPTFSRVLIRGEISNLKIHGSGHYYFTLKDAKSRISAVMFASNARLLKYRLEDGMEVVVSASLGVYEATGAYQLYVTHIEPAGIGALYVQFEQLKKELQEKGLFDQKYKKPIPRFPQKIGIISAPSGAAIHDIITTLSRRFPLASRTLIPALVQGKEAEQSLINSLLLADTLGFDVIILARGGGSLEDLNAFNQVNLAYTIFNLKTPLISGIGHEVDFTIADFVSDVRAPTPTAAAEIATPNIFDLLNYTQNLTSRLVNEFSNIVKLKKNQLVNLANRNVLLNPEYLTFHKFTTLDHLSTRLANSKNTIFFKFEQHLKRSKEMMIKALEDKIKSYDKVYSYRELLNLHFVNLYEQKNNRFALSVTKLDSLSPLKVMSRGYALVKNQEKKVVTSISQLSLNQKISLELKDGIVTSNIVKMEEK